MIGLDKIFSSRVFFIPRNQRGYSWNIREIDDLFIDLDLMGDKCHYLGTLICTKYGDFMDQQSCSPSYKYILEDGQQRLTTLLIIINEIKKRFIEIDGHETVESQQLSRIVTYQEKGEPVCLRVRNHNQFLDEALSHLLMGNPASLPANKSPSIRFMERAVSYVRERIGSIETKEALISMRNKVCYQVQLIDVDLSVVQVDRYLTFDAINSRGLPLTEFDKIKNFCILICERRKLECKPDEHWYKSISNLERFGVASRGKESAFISDLYSTFHGMHVSESEVHERFVKEYRSLLEKEDKGLEERLLKFIGCWIAYSEAWGFVSAKDKVKYNDNIVSADAIRWLNSLDNLNLAGVTKKIVTAFLFHRLDDQDKDFELIVRACEIYTFRMHALCRYRIDKNSKQLLELANQVLNFKKGAGDVLLNISNIMNQSAPLDASFKNLLTGDLNYTTWRNYLYYLLYEYELGQCASGVAPLSWAATEEAKVNSIEHIMPQEHRDDAYWQETWPEYHKAEEYVHRIGNLVLTQGNSVLGRKSISDKVYDSKAAYCYTCPKATNSEKLIPKYLDDSKDWVASSILNRELDIIRFAARRWTIPSVKDNSNLKLPDIYVDNIAGHSGEVAFSFGDCIDAEFFESVCSEIEIA